MKPNPKWYEQHVSLGTLLPSLNLFRGKAVVDPAKPKKLDFDRFYSYPIPGIDSRFFEWSKRKFIQWDKQSHKLRINQQKVFKRMRVDALEFMLCCRHCLQNYGRLYGLKRTGRNPFTNEPTRYSCPNCGTVTK